MLKWPRLVIANEGSTCRDHLAWERNLLSYLKLSLLLFVVGTVLSVKFQFVSSPSQPAPASSWAKPLGIVFQAASISTVGAGLLSFFQSQRQAMQRKGFVQTSKLVQLLVSSIGLLCVGTCILLLVTRGV